MPRRTPQHSTVAETEVKKSRFICSLQPVEDKAGYTAHLDTLRKQYPDARHHCSACLIGDPLNPDFYRADDDGEPSGSAGRPMLELLQKQGVANVSVVVVRYFGGIKLGVGGLMRAYRGAVGVALEQVELVEFTPRVQKTLKCDFAAESAIRRMLTRYDASCLEANYGAEVVLEVSVPEGRLDDLMCELVEQRLLRSMPDPG